MWNESELCLTNNDLSAHMVYFSFDVYSPGQVPTYQYKYI